MKRTGSGWLLSRCLSPRLLLPIGLAFLLPAVSCSGSLSPEDVVNLYLSEVNQGDQDDALKRWETSEVGPSLAVLDPKQEQVRLKGRQALAVALTEALVIAGQRLRWEREDASYYDLQNGIPAVKDDDKNADLASIGIRLIVERRGEDDLEERVAFNLRKAPDQGWRITGLDKGLAVLEPFLDSLRELQ